ncbi:hypothetical protein VST01_16435, partial [Escherichia coli]|nr:hypothetical protein [Escherichia coli]
MLRMFIPTSNGKISRRQYIFSFILTNLICILLISFFSNAGSVFFVLIFTILLHYLVIGNDSNLLIVFYVQIMPDDFVMQLHR